MSTTQPQNHPFISEAEYLAGEKLAEVRHEYVNGQVYAMAGASKRHNRIVRNFISRLGGAADKAGCELFFSDIKVRSEKHKSYYYPDVVLGCEEDGADDYYLEKPCLIIEVTSASTLRKDYLEKALSYQAIPSLQAYLIVAQDKPQVDMLVREDDVWLLRQFDDLNDSVDLPCLDIPLNLTEIYAGVAPD